MTSDSMLTGSCHCGAVTVQVPDLPAYAIDCNCSLCRRVHGLWAYYKEDSVRVQGATDEYIWGDKTLRTMRCANCGSVTHWLALQPLPDGRMGVNMRNFAPEVVAQLKVRRFDGADTWAYLD